MSATTKRYSLTVNPMAHRNGWDLFGELVHVTTVSSGLRVEGGELVVLDVETTDDGHDYLEAALETDDNVIGYSVRS